MRRIASLVSCVALVGAAVVGFTTPATAKPTAASGIQTSPYVALGDSYSSAAGVNPLVATAPPVCSRSQLNYARNIVAVTLPESFTDVTCSGATTSNFFSSQSLGVAPQLNAVNKSTRFVTMTIGGNDEGVFVDSFFGCSTVAPGQVYGNPCEQKFGTTYTDLIKSVTYRNLVRALSAARAKAPKATIAILGYPQILPPVGDPLCYPAVPISMGDVPWLVNQQMVLNDAVRRAAAATGALYVDTFTSSAGRDACAPVGTRWMEPVSTAINALALHPNAAGEAAMAKATLAAIGR